MNTKTENTTVQMDKDDLTTFMVMRCEACGENFDSLFDRCPACGCKTATGVEMDNPILRFPMEDILNASGHLAWLLGVVGCIVLLWNTGNQDEGLNKLMVLAGFAFLLFSIIFSVSLFALSEMLSRVIRIQRRVRAYTRERMRAIS